MPPFLDGYVEGNVDCLAAGNRMIRPLGMNFDGSIAFIGIEQSECALDIARRIFRVVLSLHGAIRH